MKQDDKGMKYKGGNFFLEENLSKSTVGFQNKNQSLPKIFFDFCQGLSLGIDAGYFLNKTEIPASTLKVSCGELSDHNEDLFGMMALIKEKKCKSHKRYKRHNHKKPSDLRHLTLRVRVRDFYLADHNSSYEKNQGENYAPDEIQWNKGFAGDDSNDQNGKGYLAAVIKKFCDIIPSILFHAAKFSRCEAACQ